MLNEIYMFHGKQSKSVSQETKNMFHTKLSVSCETY